MPGEGRNEGSEPRHLRQACRRNIFETTGQDTALLGGSVATCLSISNFVQLIAVS